MADLIDRKELRDALYEADAVTMQGVKIINQFPAVNAVEVVRCKDCKYQGYCMRRIPFFGRNLILELNIAEYHPLGFCSYGERKDGDE